MTDAYNPLPTEAPRAAPRIRLARPDMGDEEIDAVARVLRSGILTNGPATAEFERRMAERHDTEHAVAFANGTVALQALYTAFGIGPGDEVIVPSLTFISTATSVLHAGATPVFADVEPEAFNLDPAAAAKRITPRTRAVVAVHYGGQPADLTELRSLTDDAGVVLVEDAAEAHGATYAGRPVGSWGAAGMFSFTPTKNITTGEGGVVTTDDGDLALKLRLLRNHGQTAVYRHDHLGYNWRISELQAAVCAVQVRKLDAIVARKRANAEWMRQRLAGIDGLRPPVVRPGRDHVYMLYTVLLEPGIARDRVLESLISQGIEARVYFPPAHLQPVFRQSSSGPPRGLPVTEDVAGRILSLPFHSFLDHSDLEEIAAALEASIDAGRR